MCVCVPRVYIIQIYNYNPVPAFLDQLVHSSARHREEFVGGHLFQVLREGPEEAPPKRLRDSRRKMWSGSLYEENLPSGKHTKSYWKLQFIVGLPIENCDFP